LLNNYRIDPELSHSFSDTHPYSEPSAVKCAQKLELILKFL
jgi:hypothetical protein